MNFAQGKLSSSPPSKPCWGSWCTSTRPWRTCRGTPWSQGRSSASCETCGFLSRASPRCRGRPVTSSCKRWRRCLCSCCPAWWGPRRCLWKGRELYHHFQGRVLMFKLSFSQVFLLLRDLNTQEWRIVFKKIEVKDIWIIWSLYFSSYIMFLEMPGHLQSSSRLKQDWSQ